MKGATKNLKQLLNSGKFIMADLYTFELTTGQKLCLTSYDALLAFGGETYRPALLQRTMTNQKAGLMVDEVNVTCNFTDQDRINNIPLIQAFVAGTFDNAFLTIYRAFMPTDRPLDTNAGAVFIFSGRVDVEHAGRTTVELAIKSVSELFNIKLPRNLWMPTCQHTVYDAVCMLQKANYTAYGTISSGSTKAVLVTSMTQADGYFDYGVLTITSGPNNNVRMSVQHYARGIFFLTRSLPYDPVPTDSFSVSAGCDKLLGTCRTKFNNTQNFRGFPFIPRPETLL